MLLVARESTRTRADRRLAKVQNDDSDNDLGDYLEDDREDTDLINVSDLGHLKDPLDLN